VIRCKSFAHKFLRCGVVAFADEASSLSLQNNKISVREPSLSRQTIYRIKDDPAVEAALATWGA